MSIEWDKFKRPENGDYPDRWRPETPGDTITGRIATMRVATMPDGSQYPSLTLDTETGQRELLASQTMLLQRMAALQPKVGDTIRVTFTEVEKLAGGKTLKHFTVETVGTAPTRNPDTIL